MTTSKAICRDCSAEVDIQDMVIKQDMPYCTDCGGLEDGTEESDGED